ncbi:hypothetical protein VPHD148_0138 [Vibrio phage D148]
MEYVIVAKEIERKFIVNKEMFLRSPLRCTCGSDTIGITQGYLFNVKNHIGRIRKTSDGKVKFTYKGPTKGISRTEVEFSVPELLGSILLRMCSKTIHKTRTTVELINVKTGRTDTWEVDEFHNLVQPLVLAEIELESECQEYYKPDFIGEEVSHDAFYYNSNLTNMVV